MAHNISTFGNNRRGFYSLRKNAWHSLGTVVEKSLSDPGILDAAGLNWTAERMPLYRSDMEAVKDHVAIVRSDDKRQLGIVGDRYQPLQNDALLAFFRGVAGTKDLTVETAGSLGDGETVWALARIPGLTLERGDDISQGYMLIRNSHDGSSSLRVVPTMIRVVCANTLAMADAESQRRGKRHGRNTLSGGWNIRHTVGMERALEDIADAYARTMADYEETRQAFTVLTSRPLSSAAFDAMMAAAFKTNAESESERSKTMIQNRKDRIAAILASATCNVAGTAGTLWAGLQSITEYIDHDARTRGAEGDSDTAQRFVSACFDGAGSKAKAAAWDAALSLV